MDIDEGKEIDEGMESIEAMAIDEERDVAMALDNHNEADSDDEYTDFDNEMECDRDPGIEHERECDDYDEEMETTPSAKAVAALADFRKELPADYWQHTVFVKHMVFFLTDKYDVKLFLEPLFEGGEFHSFEEQESARRDAVFDFSRAFKKLHEGYFLGIETDVMKDNIWQISSSADLSYEFLVRLLQWHVNRTQDKSLVNFLAYNVKEAEEAYRKIQRERAIEKLDSQARKLRRLSEHIAGNLDLGSDSAENKGLSSVSSVSSVSKKVLEVSKSRLEKRIRRLMMNRENPGILGEPTQLSKSQLEKRISRTSSKPKVEGCPFHHGSIGRVDRAHILAYLLSKVGEKHADRYSSLLDSVGKRYISEELEKSLTPAIRSVCDDGDFRLKRLQELGPDPTDSSDAGVYLHILWTNDTPKRFWLYVGQSANFKKRLERHQDSDFRNRNPCLHYHIWDFARDMQSRFVILAIHKAPQSSNEQLMLNLQEMWMSCVFQSLTTLQLANYLRHNARRLWSGDHLNVALPLWQGYTQDSRLKAVAIGGREAFTEFLKSDDEATRHWANSMRAAFNNLRNSLDPLLRGYYSHHLYRRNQAAQKVLEVQVYGRYRKFLSGVSTQVVKVVREGGRTVFYVKCGMFSFWISKGFHLALKGGEEVIVQFHLTETQNPMVYATRALSIDPACRLAVSVNGKDCLGEFEVWLESIGKKKVMIMNSLVDALEEVSREETRGFSRRWYQTNSIPRMRSPIRTVYTKTGQV